MELKPPKTYEEQYNILVSRNLIIPEKAEALKALSRYNYYRLSGYFHYFQDKETNMFYQGTTFEKIIKIHEFDSKFRLLLLDLLFDIEIELRTKLAYHVGHEWGADGYLKRENYDESKRENFDLLMDSINEDVERSKEKFIQTHKDKYEGKLPIWAVVEVTSFGDLSKLYSLIPERIQKNISYDYGINHILFSNWIYTASLLRNVCAHNARLYGRRMSTPIKVAKAFQYRDIIKNNSIYAYLIAIKKLSHNEHWNQFNKALSADINEYKQFLNLYQYGFIPQWESTFG